MMNKLLTYFTILAITVLPVQLISANAENMTMQLSMLKSMNQQTQMKKECMSMMPKQHVTQKEQQKSVNKSYCDDYSNNCQNCNDYPQAASAVFLPSYLFEKISPLKTQLYSTRYLFLDGIPQQNLLRPPRTPI